MVTRVGSKKVTFSIPVSLTRDMKQAVAERLYASQNVLVRIALEEELQRARNERLRREFQEAARDPMFLRDLEETQKAFASADAESARMIPNDHATIAVASRKRKSRSRKRV